VQTSFYFDGLDIFVRQKKRETWRSFFAQNNKQPLGKDLFLRFIDERSKKGKKEQLEIIYTLKN